MSSDIVYLSDLHADLNCKLSTYVEHHTHLTIKISSDRQAKSLLKVLLINPNLFKLFPTFKFVFIAFY